MLLPYKLVTRRTTKNSQKAPCALSLDSVLKKHRKNKCLAAQDGLTEPDPLRDHLSDPSDLDDITQHSDKASEYEEDEKNKQTIQTESGELAIQKHGLMKCEHKKMNSHMRDTHTHLKFQCGVCDILYSTYNAAYRHTQCHFKLRYECDQYDHKSQFPHQLHTHKRTHTHKHLLPCTCRGCTKKFTSKRSMWKHLQAHSPDKGECKKCDPPKTFETKSNFRQHEKGAHSLGWMSYFGKLHPCQNITSKGVPEVSLH